MKTLLLASSALLGLVLPTFANAQAAPNLVDTVVVTGAKSGDFGVKSGIPLAQVPQSIQVLDAAEFLDRGVQSIGDILKVVPSANIGAARVSSYQGFSVKVRGFRADQIRNGVRQRYYYNIDPSATSNIERVEVLKGPSAVLYGPSLAGGGLVSIITKRPQEEFGGNVSGLVGSYDQKSATFDVTGPISKDAGLYFRATGEIERSGTFVDHTDLKRDNLAFSLTWKATDRVTAYFVSEWQQRDTKRGVGLPVVGTLVPNGVAQIPISRFLGDPNQPFTAKGGLIQAWVDLKLNDAWTLTPRLSYATFDGDYYELFVRAVAADGVTVARTGRWNHEIHDYPIGQVDLTGQADAMGLRHNLLFGVEYALEKVRYEEATIPTVPSINTLNPVYGAALVGPYALTTVHKREVPSWSVYAQDRLDLTDRWNIVLGARGSWYDFHRVNSVNHTSPVTVTDAEFDFSTVQLGSTYKLDGGWSLFGGYSTGFSTEATAGGRSFNGSTFDPDHSQAVEVGLRYAQDRVSASASLFQIERSNVVTSDPDHPGFSIQTGAIRSQGLEVEGAWQIADRLSVQGGYAYMQGEVTRSNSGNQGFKLADIPKHAASAYLRYDLPSLPVQLRGGVRYVGDRPFSDTANVTLRPGLLANTVTQPAYTTVDLGATWRFSHARLDLSVVNLADETYFTRDFNDFNVIPGEPRQANLRLTVDF